MKNLIKFNDYLINKILENMKLKVGKLELILSQRLIKILKDVNHKIAKDLLALHSYSDPDYQKTFVDLGTSSDEVTFIQSNKVPDLLEPDITHGEYHREYDKEHKYTGGFYDYIPMVKNPWISDTSHVPDLHSTEFHSKDHPVWTNNRVPINVGRFISQSFPGKYHANHTREQLSKMATPDDIESFVNMFKATVESHGKKFEIVKGEDIRKWYNGNRYLLDRGTLGGSCMKSSSKSNYLDLYCNNPDKVQMIILFPEEIRDKIIGRALIWKTEEPEGRTYMDRIYINNDSDEYMFIEYAKKNGWLYKSAQQYGYNINIIDPKTEKTDRIEMKITVTPEPYEYFPYVDTFQFYNQKTGVLTNNKNIVDSSWIKLTSADGGRRSINE